MLRKEERSAFFLEILKEQFNDFTHHDSYDKRRNLIKCEMQLISKDFFNKAF